MFAFVDALYAVILERKRPAFERPDASLLPPLLRAAAEPAASCLLLSLSLSPSLLLLLLLLLHSHLLLACRVRSIASRPDYALWREFHSMAAWTPPCKVMALHV